MGMAFRPSRSGYYGAPYWRAVQGLADQAMGQIRQIDDQQYADEYRRQMSNAEVALMRERYGLERMMAEHAKEPMSWLGRFQQNKGKIRDAVLKGVRLPEVRENVGLGLNEEFARWEIELSQKSKTQSEKNRIVDYDAAIQSIVGESREYKTFKDALADFSRAGKLIERNEPTPEAVAFKMRWAGREIFGDYLIQEALRRDDPAIVERANEVVPTDILDDQGEKPLFGPEELADLKKRYDATVDAAKKEAKEIAMEQALAFERQATIDLANGKLTFKDGQGNDISYWDAIQNHPGLSPDTIRTLQNGYKAATKPTEDKPVSPTAASQAYMYVRRQTQRYLNGEIDRKRWHDVFNKYQVRLDKADRKDFIDQVYPMGKPADSQDKQIRDAMDEADEEATGAAWSLSLLEGEPRPAETPEVAEFAGTVLKHMNDWVATQRAAGKAFDSQAFRVERNRFIYELLDDPDRFAKPPKGLESVWLDMTKEERADARVLLDAGVAIERILEALK